MVALVKSSNPPLARIHTGHRGQNQYYRLLLSFNLLYFAVTSHCTFNLILPHVESPVLIRSVNQLPSIHHPYPSRRHFDCSHRDRYKTPYFPRLHQGTGTPNFFKTGEWFMHHRTEVKYSINRGALRSASIFAYLSWHQTTETEGQRRKYSWYRSPDEPTHSTPTAPLRQWSAPHRKPTP